MSERADGIGVVRRVADLRARVAAWRREGATVGLVPTMGALHAGHVALVRRALANADKVIVSLFVNPTQFGPDEDFSQYPRQEAEDMALLSAAGCNLLYAPLLEEMYPPGFATGVSVPRLSQGLCGDHRPGHFDGVATVVAKLLLQAQADIAVFGEKDYQQLILIRRLVADLDITTKILSTPVIRDADGLALSSRNAYLTASQKRVGLALPRALNEAASALLDGREAAKTLSQARNALAEAGVDGIDYFELRDAATLEPLATLDRPARLIAAIRVGGVRLLDNVPVEPRRTGD